MKIVKLEIAPNDPKPNKESGIKSTLHIYVGYTVLLQVQNFRLFRSTISRFQDIAHVRIFPLTPMLKVQSATKFLIFGRLSKHV